MLNLKKIIFLTALIAFSFVYLPAEEVAEADNVKVPINLNSKFKPINSGKKFNNNLKLGRPVAAEKKAAAPKASGAKKTVAVKRRATGK